MASNEPTPWTAGQRVALNRERIVTIERVTPSGRFYVEGKMFRANGFAFGETSMWSGRDKVDVLTQELEARVAKVQRVNQAAGRLSAALHAADDWHTKYFGGQRRSDDPTTIERAEALTAAIKAAMEGWDD